MIKQAVTSHLVFQEWGPPLAIASLALFNSSIFFCSKCCTIVTHWFLSWHTVAHWRAWLWFWNQISCRQVAQNYALEGGDMFCVFNIPFIGACSCLCPICWSLFSESNILSGVFCLLQGPPFFVPQRYRCPVRLLHKVMISFWLLSLSHYLLVGLILSFLGTCLSLPSGPVYLVKK